MEWIYNSKPMYFSENYKRTKHTPAPAIYVTLGVYFLIKVPFLGCNWYKTYCTVTFYFISWLPLPRFSINMSAGGFNVLESGKAKAPAMYGRLSFFLELFFQSRWACSGTLGNLILPCPPAGCSRAPPRIGGRKRSRGPEVTQGQPRPGVGTGATALPAKRVNHEKKAVFEPLGKTLTPRPEGCLKWGVIRRK